MKSYYLLLIFFTFLIMNQIISSHNLKRVINSASIKNNINDNTNTPSFIEKNSKGFGLTSTITLKPEFDEEDTESEISITKNFPTGISKQIGNKKVNMKKANKINYVQKKEKISNTVETKKALKTEVKTEVKAVKSEVKALKTEVKTEVKSLKTETSTKTVTSAKALAKTEVETKKNVFDRLPGTPLSTLNFDAKREIKNYNFDPVFEKEHTKNIEQPNYVKSLQKDHPRLPPAIPSTFESVQIVKKLSPAGQADLKLRDFHGDKDYMRILKGGWESPMLTNTTIEKTLTPIMKASRVDYLWNHPGQNGNIWGNVELNRYGQHIGNKWSASPAKFYVDRNGSPRVDAPPNSSMEIRGQAATIYNIH